MDLARQEYTVPLTSELVEKPGVVRRAESVSAPTDLLPVDFSRSPVVDHLPSGQRSKSM